MSFKNFSFVLTALLTVTRGLAFSLSRLLTCLPSLIISSFDLEVREASQAVLVVKKKKKKNPPANAGDMGLGWEGSLDESMATHSSILA